MASSTDGGETEARILANLGLDPARYYVTWIGESWAARDRASSQVVAFFDRP